MSSADHLRRALREYVDDAPAGAGLLDAVRARSRHLRRHRRLSVAGGAVVTLVVAIAAPLVISRLPAGEVSAAGEVSLAGEGSAARSAAPDPLVPPSYEAPSFPFTPGWVPDGFGEPHFRKASDHVELRHFRSGATPSFTSADPNVSVTIRPEDTGRDHIGFDWDITEEPVTVRGHDAVLYTGRSDESVPEEVADNRSAAVSWADSSGRWVTVVGLNGFGAAEVIRYAEELIDEPFPGQAPFTFDLVPAGVELRSSGPHAMSFTPTGERGDEPTGTLSAFLFRAGPGDPDICLLYQLEEVETCGTSQREPVRVGEHDAEVVDEETVVVFLDDGLALGVRATGTLALSREDLLRLAGGIELTRYAVPPA